jgi:hypothetical protein
MYATCCCPCAIGTTLSNTVGKMNYKSQPIPSFYLFIMSLPCLGMPFLMGCCCVGLCGARNLVRYQYRIGGDECFDDFCFPAMISGAASCLASCGIICLPCVLGFFSYFVAVIMKILKESEVQLKARGGVPGFYLSSPPASEMNNNNEVMSPVYINSHGVVATPTTAVSVPHNQEPTVVAVEFSNSGSKNM